MSFCIVKVYPQIRDSRCLGLGPDLLQKQVHISKQGVGRIWFKAVLMDRGEHPAQA
jgi:hypothetical protein